MLIAVGFFRTQNIEAFRKALKGRGSIARRSALGKAYAGCKPYQGDILNRSIQDWHSPICCLSVPQGTSGNSPAPLVPGIKHEKLWSPIRDG